METTNAPSKVISLKDAQKKKIIEKYKRKKVFPVHKLFEIDLFFQRKKTEEAIERANQNKLTG